MKYETNLIKHRHIGLGISLVMRYWAPWIGKHNVQDCVQCVYLVHLQQGPDVSLKQFSRALARELYANAKACGWMWKSMKLPNGKRTTNKVKHAVLLPSMELNRFTFGQRRTKVKKTP